MGLKFLGRVLVSAVQLVYFCRPGTTGAESGNPNEVDLNEVPFSPSTVQLDAITLRVNINIFEGSLMEARKKTQVGERKRNQEKVNGDETTKHRESQTHQTNNLTKSKNTHNMTKTKHNTEESNEMRRNICFS